MNINGINTSIDINERQGNSIKIDNLILVPSDSYNES